jgi:prepilin-type N-terminal cleavage/methylation domain-containing protein
LTKIWGGIIFNIYIIYCNKIINNKLTHMNRNIKRTSKGFTLLEILLVIAVIGILAAIVLVSINPNRQINQARQAAINSDKNTIEKALQQVLIDTGSYPTAIDGVQRKICSNTVATDCINITTDLEPTYIAAIPESTTYTVARGNDGRVYVNTTETSANFSCPTGYIKVPGNSLYQTKDFCVMKYEAKAVDISNPTVGLLTPNTGFNTIANNTTPTTSANGRAVASVASGYPIARISQITAAQYCKDAGASLISNAEWMTIARNIEGQLSNWTTGIAASTAIGIGGFYRGHTDNSPATALEAGLDIDGYTGTGNSGFSIERRTHTLSNGEVIWDLSGNVWEWLSDTVLAANKPNHNITGPMSYQEWTVFNTIHNYGSFSYDLLRPSNSSWSSGKNMGTYYMGSIISGTYAFNRGGVWNVGSDAPSNAGIFSLFLYASSGDSSRVSGGFRCVLR